MGKETTQPKLPEQSTGEKPKRPYIVKDMGYYANEKGQRIMEYQLVAGDVWPEGMAQFHGLGEVTLWIPPGAPRSQQQQVGPLPFDFPIPDAQTIVEAYELYQEMYTPMGEKFAAFQIEQYREAVRRQSAQIVTMAGQPGMEDILRHGPNDGRKRGGRIFPGR